MKITQQTASNPVATGIRPIASKRAISAARGTAEKKSDNPQVKRD